MNEYFAVQIRSLVSKQDHWVFASEQGDEWCDNCMTLVVSNGEKLTDIASIDLFYDADSEHWLKRLQRTVSVLNEINQSYEKNQVRFEFGIVRMKVTGIEK